MNYIERMEEELDDLEVKIEKLLIAITTIKSLTDDELGLMYAQLYSMRGLEKILSDRIFLAKKIHNQ